MPSKITRPGTAFRGLFPSHKNHCQVPYHSLGELGACLLLEFAPRVARYRSCQDRQFRISSDGDEFGYTPDYEVIHIDGDIHYIEVKPKSECRRPSVADRLARARSGLADAGYPLYIWDESITEAWPRHETLKLLRPWLGKLSEVEVLEARDLIERVQPKTVRSLVHLARTRERAMAWLANGAVGIDVDQPFTQDAEVFSDQQGIRHAPIFY